jgi:UDP-N-acetyl-D-mannosaminuronate dehydrogenase
LYKSGVADIRTSVVDQIIRRLKEHDVTLVGTDIYADTDEASEEFTVKMQSQPSFHDIDAVLPATAYNQNSIE